MEESFDVSSNYDTGTYKIETHDTETYRNLCLGKLLLTSQLTSGQFLGLMSNLGKFP